MNQLLGDFDAWWILSNVKRLLQRAENFSQPAEPALDTLTKEHRSSSQAYIKEHQYGELKGEHVLHTSRNTGLLTEERPQDGYGMSEDFPVVIALLKLWMLLLKKGCRRRI